MPPKKAAKSKPKPGKKSGPKKPLRVLLPKDLKERSKSLSKRTKAAIASGGALTAIIAGYVLLISAAKARRKILKDRHDGMKQQGTAEGYSEEATKTAENYANAIARLDKLIGAHERLLKSLRKLKNARSSRSDADLKKAENDAKKARVDLDKAMGDQRVPKMKT